MKPSSLLLALSLAANLGIAALVFSPRSTSAERTATAASSRGTGAVSAVPAGNFIPTPPDGHWNATLDDAAYVAQLRADGFPPEVIRALINARLTRRYAERLREIQGHREYAYWRQSPFSSDYSYLTKEERAAKRALDQEMREEAKKILGEDLALTPWEKAARETTMGHLSAEKIQQVDAITKDYNELAAQFRDRTKGVLLKGDREESRLLETEKRADLAAVLSPAELMEYDLRASPSASGVRYRLSFFDPSETEYRALAKIQLEFDQTYGVSNLTSAEQSARNAAEKTLPEKIQTVLGPERFADYQVTTDSAFRQAAYVLRAEGLDLNAVKEVVALQRGIVQRADAVRAQTDLTPAQRAEALAALARDATSQLDTKLGEKISSTYQKRAGEWLQRLRPPAARTPNP